MTNSMQKALKDCKRLLVLEYVTGGGLCGEPLPASLAHEGDAMLHTLLRDAQEALPDAQIVSLRDARCESIAISGVECQWVESDFHAAWREALQSADAVWIVAPETQGVLEALVREAEHSKVKVLNCSAEAIALCASKYATAQHMIAKGIPAITTWRWSESLRDNPPAALLGKAVVIKPDDGAGCLETFVYEDLASAASAQTKLEGYVVQGYMEGEAQSLSLWCECGRAELLSVNRQRIEHHADGQLRFEGCDVNIAASTSINELQHLAQRIVDAVPGLYGPVGVDGIQGKDGPWHVVEINPRLTTSFVALREARGENLMQLACGQKEAQNSADYDRHQTIEIRV